MIKIYSHKRNGRQENFKCNRHRTHTKTPEYFARFDELKLVESLTLHNEHDPKPLYFLLTSQRGDIFTPDYLEQGPEWWKITIQRKIINSQWPNCFLNTY